MEYCQVYFKNHYLWQHSCIKFFVSEACAIKLEDYLIVIDGSSTLSTVSKYDKNGWVTDLTSLNNGRRLHSCGHYYSNTKELVIFDAWWYSKREFISDLDQYWIWIEYRIILFLKILLILNYFFLNEQILNTK